MKIKKLMIYYACFGIFILTVSINSYAQFMPPIANYNLFNYGWNQPFTKYMQPFTNYNFYNFGRNQPFYIPSFNNYNYFSPGQPFFNAFGSQDSPYQAEAGNYGNFEFTTYADYVPSNIMNMPPVTNGAKYIATPHAIIWSNVSYPNGIPEGPFGTIFGSDPFGDDDDD